MDTGTPVDTTSSERRVVPLKRGLVLRFSKKKKELYCKEAFDGCEC